MGSESKTASSIAAAAASGSTSGSVASSDCALVMSSSADDSELEAPSEDPDIGVILMTRPMPG